MKKNQADMVKKEETLKKNGKDLEEISKKAVDLEKASRWKLRHFRLGLTLRKMSYICSKLR